ncbi:hypothetical protein ATE71_16750 [Sphingopyxis sp. H115]|nr:hypothetical protein ATE71_16750 [Sphingopyxis sp. H115]
MQWAQKHHEIVRVYLYGSRARGDDRADSDIDLATVMDAPDTDKAYSMWSGFKSHFDEAPDLHLSSAVHLEWYEKNAGLEKVGNGVEKDGVLLFERQIEKGD